MLNDRDIKVIVVTNQSGIARGMYNESETIRFNEALQSELKQKNAYIDGFYHCPHHPEAKIKKYRKKCDCRKPNPGMILQAAEEHDIDLEKSYMIGDRKRDIAAGKKAGCKTIHVLTGVGKEENTRYDIKADYSFNNLYEAVNNLIKKII